MIEISAIKLSEEFDSYKKSEDEKAVFLEPISKINIFVGSNNSGKSRFMRLLSSRSKYEVKQNSVDLEGELASISAAIENMKGFFTEYNIAQVGKVDMSQMISLQESVDDLLTIGDDRYQSFRNLFQNSNAGFLEIKTASGGVIINHENGRIIHNKASELRSDIVNKLKQLPIQSQKNAFKKVYVPTLRGLRLLDSSHTDFYLDRTRQDYFPNQLDSTDTENRYNPEIFTGLSLYNRIADLLLGNNSERKLIDQYLKFISRELFEGKSVDLIPNQKERVVIVKIGSEKEQPIHHLGDGIQSAIILSFLPFVMQEQTFFFIEEPEMYLHPGLQRKLLNFFNSRDQHTFFLTTHSNHFLDLTIDIKDVSVFNFRKSFDESDDEELSPNFTIEAVDSTCESSLELLGVRNSSVFLVNATIWVEGITDRWYLRKMLNSYMDYLKDLGQLDLKLEEDNHYSFVEYGGANITHWSFLDYEEHPIEVKRLCAKAILVIDQDGEKKEKRKEDLQKVLGDRLIILPCREVENLLPYSVIKQVVSDYEKKPDLELPKFTHNSYKDVYLGTFIEDRILKNNISRTGGYKGKSGTIKNKVDFCERALKYIEYEILSDSAKTVIQNIYNFICSQNK